MDSPERIPCHHCQTVCMIGSIVQYQDSNIFRNYKKQTAVATQSRFLISPPSAPVSSYTAPRWWVPITFAPAGGDFNNTFPNTTWLSKDQESIKVSGLPDKKTAVVFNVQETGYYRVNYDEKNWRLINRQLHKPKGHLEIHVANR